MRSNHFTMRFFVVLLVLASLLAIGSAQSCSEGYTYNSRVGVCFKYYTDPVVFADAEEQCQDDGAVMPSLHSKEIEQYITGRLERKGVGLWLGLQRSADETWKWSDGTPFDYEAWVTGYPTNGASETCAFIGGTDGSVTPGWRNWSCDELKLRFICIKPTI